MEITFKGRHTTVPERFRRHAAAKLAKLEKLDHRAMRIDVEVSTERNPRQSDHSERVELTIRSREPAIRAEAAADDRYAALDLAFAKLEARLRRAAERRKGRRADTSVRSVEVQPVPSAAGQSVTAETDSAPGTARSQQAADEPTDPQVRARLVADDVIPSQKEGDGPVVVREEDAYATGGYQDEAEAEAAVSGLVPIKMEGEGPLVVREKFHASHPMTIDQALLEMELVGHDFFLFRDHASGHPSVVYRRHGYQYGLLHLHEEAGADVTRQDAPSERVAAARGSGYSPKSPAGGAGPSGDPPSRGSAGGEGSAGGSHTRGSYAGGGGATGEPPGRDSAGGGGSQARRRYLKGQYPETIPVGKPFSFLASIVLAARNSVELEPFDVPPEGRDVLLVVHAPRLRLISDQRQTVHVPADGDSRPVMFELSADAPGPRPVSVTAWLNGSYLGELLVEVTAERDHPPGPLRDFSAEIATEPTEGAVSLVVRYDPVQNAYRFEFRDEDNPDEVTSNLAYDPGPIVEHLVADLDELAKGRTGYSATQTRDYLVNSGARLWQELVPERLREQFWDRQHRIRQLTILADKDAVPWELLYPMDPGYDAGFLVEQFPVTRAVFGRRPTRRLNLQPARFVLPDGSPPEARTEIEALQRLFDPQRPTRAVINALTPLLDLIRGGDFGLLHFACHNRFDPTDGSLITLDKRQFTPTLMTTAAINHALATSAPTVFINACRTAGLSATYNRLDGWANKFLEAGAAAFIGSLWAVSDATGREFAGELYSHLQAGFTLGKALLCARRAASSQPGDPTWLAYTVYGDPRATISQ